MSKTKQLRRVAIGFAALLMALTSATNLLSKGVKDWGDVFGGIVCF